MITEVVESEPMKGVLGSPKWVAIQRTTDGLDVKLPKGVEMLAKEWSNAGGWQVVLWVEDDNVRSQQDSSSSSPEPLV